METPLPNKYIIGRLEMIIRNTNSLINLPDLLKQLQSHYYASVSFPIERKYLEEAIESFFKFLEQPQSVKEHIDFRISTLHRRGEIGFKHRDSSDDIYNDSKDFFHFHPAILGKYADFLKENLVVGDFITKANVIWDLTYHTVLNIITLLNNTYPGVKDNIFNTDDVHIILRFLKYNWDTSAKYLAKPHFDAGSFTLAIAESSPGLRIGSGPLDLQLVTHNAQQAIFMLSSNFKKIMPAENLKAGWHDVVQLDDNYIGKPYARWAIVAFIEGHSVTALPRTETHKWYMNS